MLFSSDIKLRGKHAIYAQYLCKERGALRKDEDENIIGVNVFTRVMDLYLLAPIIGLNYGQKAKIDNSINKTSTIQYSTVYDNQDALNYIYRMVIMCDSDNDKDDNEKVALAFKYDDDEEQSKKNKAIFDSYVCGGIEYLYDIFKDDLNDEEAIFRHMLEMINSFDPAFLEELNSIKF